MQMMGKNGYFQSFLNGEPADLSKLALKPGENKLAVFVKIGPRPKLGGFVGAVGTRCYSGLWGDYTTADKPVDRVAQWKVSPMTGSGTGPSTNDFNDQGWPSASYSESAPESKLGTNSLVILDIAGTRPSRVKLDRYEVCQLVQNRVTSR
jgi:hypothetical protein